MGWLSRLRVDWRDLVRSSDGELLLAAAIALLVFAAFVVVDEKERLGQCQALLDAYGAQHLPSSCETTAVRWGTAAPPDLSIPTETEVVNGSQQIPPE